MNKNNQAKPLNVLLVDDEKGFLNVLSNRLAKRSIHATLAFSGTQAIQTLRTQDFHVIVLDLKMEDMDGLEVLKIIKTMAPDLPVIILTGHGFASEEGMKLGAVDYLTKPCEFTELTEKIRRASQSVTINKTLDRPVDIDPGTRLN